MFLGTYTPKLDEKGRIILPARFREELTAGLVLARNQERSIVIWPRAVFEAEALRALEGPSTLQKVRDYQRMLAAGATEETPDKQGRITIPPPLRQWAGLERDVVVIGALNRVEVWSPEGWEAYSAAQEEAFAGMNEIVFPQ
ncbi:division/cell wall cluster transcriptional repressor MraZ [Propionicicella superfundia]|uniref:division/cell wall cluster transcriptional repressor MraZ n=1 Tax=Propionicicella superfundia TaxID=348582 RepID=UPI00048FB1F7|nr:division/cell wall cluster transcriptional repressor MraZ [Propionicicella superfundia]